MCFCFCDDRRTDTIPENNDHLYFGGSIIHKTRVISNPLIQFLITPVANNIFRNCEILLKERLFTVIDLYF